MHCKLLGLRFTGGSQHSHSDLEEWPMSLWQVIAVTRRAGQALQTAYRRAAHRQLGNQICICQVVCEIGSPVRIGYSQAKFVITSAT